VRAASAEVHLASARESVDYSDQSGVLRNSSMCQRPRSPLARGGRLERSGLVVHPAGEVVLLVGDGVGWLHSSLAPTSAVRTRVCLGVLFLMNVGAPSGTTVAEEVSSVGES